MAVEALLAFYLELSFLGIWIFGRDMLLEQMYAVECDRGVSCASRMEISV